MSLSRRDFVRMLGLGGAGAVGASAFPRAPVAAGPVLPETLQPMNRRYDAGFINLSSNTSPRGPGEAVLEALRARISAGLGRYPGNVGLLTEAIAEKEGVARDHILLSTGSGEILNGVVRAFVTPTRPLVNGSPSYETPERTSRNLGLPVKVVPVDASQRLDLDAMADASRGAGLLYLCNPNNPTGMAQSEAAIADVVRAVKATSPDTMILIDEAYLEFAKDPSVKTAAALAPATPGVVVTRTFSKIYALAAMRMGYAIGQPETLDSLRAAARFGSVTMLSAAAGLAALSDSARVEWEIAENHQVREFTLNAFREMGYSVTDSQTNFVWANVRQSAKQFREACFELKVLVGRDFPPMENDHSRISLGTMDEMRQAVEVFRRVLTESS